MLSISNLHVSAGDKPILKGLTLDIPADDARMRMAISPEGHVG